MNKLNPKDLTAAVPAVAATVALYAACAAMLCSRRLLLRWYALTCQNGVEGISRLWNN